MELLFAIFFYPILVIILSIIGYNLTKSLFIMPTLTFLVFSVLTLTILNSTFFFWVVIFTIISFITSLITKHIKNKKKTAIY
ncbi:DUF2651 family protein [Ectobacillus antri]|uniref:DUF2651 family protein n=1 Tax=Ectobacillus antri TaxID=2486280 RepID=UPI000F59D519